MSFKRHPPKLVKQNGNKDCWAAALESWTDAVGDPPRKQTQANLTKDYPDGMDYDIFRFWAAAGLGMSTAFLTVDDFYSDHIEEFLHKFSVLFVSNEIEKYTIWWHVVVLYGVSTTQSDAPAYYVMDPATGRLTTRRKTDFFPTGADRKVLIGWKVKGQAGTVY